MREQGRQILAHPVCKSVPGRVVSVVIRHMGWPGEPLKHTVVPVQLLATLMDDRDALMRPYSPEELSPCRYSRARSPPPLELGIGLHLQVIRAYECNAIDTTEEVPQFSIPRVFMAEV